MIEEKYYIGRTSAYYDDDDDSLDDFFVPHYWEWANDPMELAGDVHELNTEGQDLMFAWIEDVSRGYNLCSGRAYGLAAQYSREEIYDKLCAEEYSSKQSDNRKMEMV